MSDVFYLWVFLSFFLTLGILAPLINDEFNTTIIDHDAGSIMDEDETTGASTLTIGSILLNILTIPFWTFGLPAWFNLSFLLIIRIVFIFVVVRNIWIGGGS